MAHDENSQFVFVGHAMRAGMDSGRDHVSVRFGILLAGPAEPKEGRDRRRPNPPEPIRVVVADDPRERIATCEELQGTRLSVVRDERDRARPLGFGDREVRL